MPDELLVSLLRGDAVDPRPLEAHAAAIADASAREGVAPLLYLSLADAGLRARAAALYEALAPLARAAALVESVYRADIEQVTTALAAAGIEPLIFKGTALAYTVYPQPWTRPRGDTDLLIEKRHRAEAAAVLGRLGFTRTNRPTGEFVTGQFTWVRDAPFGMACDVHWRVADPLAFADLIGYTQLRAVAVEIPSLGPAARAVVAEHALLVASIHRVAHHNECDSLIRLYDIHLIARSLTGRGWRRLVDLARAAQCCAVVLGGLRAASACFATPMPEDVVADLERAGSERERTADFLGGRARRIEILRSDWRLTPAWRDRAALLRDHLLPDPEYVLEKYGSRRRYFVPALYLHRILAGAAGWFRSAR